MINLSNTSDVNKYDSWMEQGLKLRSNAASKSLKTMGLGKRIWTWLFPKQLRATDKKIVQSVTLELKRSFEKEINEPSEGQHLQSVVSLAENTLKNRRICKYSPDEAAALERWLVGVKNKHLGVTDQHYSMAKNTRYFAADEKKRDPSLFNVSQTFAENNPDFVDFALTNSLYRSAERAGNVTFGLNAENGEPNLNFATLTEVNGEWQAVSDAPVTWQELKARLKQEGALVLNGDINPKHADQRDYTTLKYQMTQWGLVDQHNYQWTELKPFAQIDNPSGKPCIQIVSYHAGKEIIPKAIGDQGHSGMIFVDSKGFVYSMGFFCHPESKFFAAFKAQRSVLRSSDSYESRVGANWQDLVKNTHQNDNQVRWNDGALQFDFEDDREDAIPCLESIKRTWVDSKSKLAGDPAQRLAMKKIDRTYKKLNHLLGSNSSMDKIHQVSAKLYSQMEDVGITAQAWTKDQKFNVLIGRANHLQEKTNEANATGNWENGALPYMLAEENCSHVSRYYFGQWAQVNLGGHKTRNVLNTRPKQNAEQPYIPTIDNKVFSSWKWARISLLSVASSKVLRIVELVPVVSTKVFGRGKGEGNIAPRTGFRQAMRNFNHSAVTPQQIREEAMDVQQKGSSIIRKIVRKFHKPSGLLPIYTA
jgi:hypothetical protein